MIIISGAGHYSNNNCHASNLRSQVASSNISSDSENIITSNENAKGSDEDKESANKDEKRYQGLKNIIAHPFRILITGAGWAFLGNLSSLIVPSISQPILALIGFVTGIATETLMIYEDGYSNGATV